jgi:hypothetical protein
MYERRWVVFGPCFQVQAIFFGHIPDSAAGHKTIQYNTIHYNTEIGEKNFNAKADLLQSQFMT